MLQSVFIRKIFMVIIPSPSSESTEPVEVPVVVDEEKKLQRSLLRISKILAILVGVALSIASFVFSATSNNTSVLNRTVSL
jgi:hypothetical protein